MGVYIKSMEMPKDCIVCPFGWNGCNKQHDFVYMGSRPDFCSLIEVPPHGRLIDADAVERNLVKMQMAQKGVVGHGIRKSRAVVRDMPTVIEGEE